MGYARASGFGAGFWQTVQATAAKATAPAPAPIPPMTIDQPKVTVPVAQPTFGPAVIPPVLQPQPILVAGPAPSPSGGGGGGGADGGLAPAAGGTGVSELLKQPAVVIGLVVLGFLALRRGGGTRKF